MLIDEFCKEFLKDVDADIYEKYNEFISEKEIKASFSEAKDCVETAAQLKDIDEQILNEFKKLYGGN